MKTKWRSSDRVDLTRSKGRSAGGPAIASDQSRRQMRTAVEILRRLQDQPGLILADEVGMGKTYTALAVAASVAIENPKAGPVVIMVPPALREKWPLDWEVFAELYLDGPAPRVATADKAVAFLKLIDDEQDKRPQIIFLRNGAFGMYGFRDSWVRLAVVRQAVLGRPSMARERRAVAKWGAPVIKAPDSKLYTPGLVAELLNTPYGRWKAVANRMGAKLDDDPIPSAMQDALSRLQLTAVREALTELPTIRLGSWAQRIAGAAAKIDKATTALWGDWLEGIDFQAPLLILDEAHHAKNPGTQLSKLFLNEAQGGGESPGALYGCFERMLFLTATPFQLGHHELLQVLSRFGGVNWESLPGEHRDFEEEIATLGRKLSDTQQTMARLDRAWGKLKPSDVSDLPEDWWETVTPFGERPARAQRAFRDSLKARKRAQTDLKRWVIRHRKPDEYKSGVARREYLRGAEIAGPSAGAGGLDVDRGTLLPFLLAGRAQVAFRAAQRSGDVPPSARALFADGICSSYEAYLDTRTGRVVDEQGQQAEVYEDGEIRWYMRAIRTALPTDDSAARAAHPKIAPVVDRVCELWRKGEKVVVFCHFRATGAALRRHISQAIEGELWSYVANEFEVNPAGAQAHIQRLSRRFERRSEGVSPVHVAALEQMREVASRVRGLDEEERAKLTEVLLRYLRSPVVLARYGRPVHRNGADGIPDMLNRSGLGGSTLRERLETFVAYMDRLVEGQRNQLLDALVRIHISSYYADVSDLAEEGEAGSEQLLATVRLANGNVKHETRRRLMLAFNSPLLPEVLVASQVLAEGVDLHHDCRYVIHHDLDWNPSTLEQRTGRVDRLGSKGERLNEPIEVALPYIAKTQDEKMYRVVRDRERWFQVVMGARHELDEAEIDDISARVELPADAAERLGFRLEIRGS